MRQTDRQTDWQIKGVLGPLVLQNQKPSSGYRISAIYMVPFLRKIEDPYYNELHNKKNRTEETRRSACQYQCSPLCFFSACILIYILTDLLEYIFFTNIILPWCVLIVMIPLDKFGLRTFVSNLDCVGFRSWVCSVLIYMSFIFQCFIG